MRTRTTLLLTLLLLALAPATARAEDRAPRQSLYQARMVKLFEQALTPESFAELHWLLHLGWTLHQDASVTELTVAGGKPLIHPTIEAAKAAGDLRINLPVGFDIHMARDFERSVGLLGDSGASRCAYKHKIAIVNKRAAETLQAMQKSGKYVFPDLLSVFESPFFRMRFPKDEWVLHEVPNTKKGKSFVANRSAAEAMEAFLERGANAECYVGQAMCCYLQQYYLYGHDWFDEVWDPLDVWVGQPRHIKDSPYGRYTRSELPYRWRALLLHRRAQRGDPALGLARYGRMAFCGVSGIVMNQVPGVQSNENFVIVSASQRAVDQIIAGGGLKVFLPFANEAWRQMNSTSGMFQSRRGRQIASQRIEQTYSSPIFKEIKVYVHPYGIVDFAYLFKKKMQVADTPTKVVIYTYGREEFAFQRYRAAVKQRFLKSRGHTGIVEAQPTEDRRPGAIRGIPGRMQPVQSARPAQPGAPVQPVPVQPARAQPSRAQPSRTQPSRVPPRPPPPPPPPNELVPVGGNR